VVMQRYVLARVPWLLVRKAHWRSYPVLERVAFRREELFNLIGAGRPVVANPADVVHGLADLVFVAGHTGLLCRHAMGGERAPSIAEITAIRKGRTGGIFGVAQKCGRGPLRGYFN